MNRFPGLDAARGITAYSIVLHHVAWRIGLSPDWDWLLRARDFGFPVIIMSSLFVLTLSLQRKPRTPLSRIYASRVKRIEVPFLLWSAIYWVLYRAERYVRFGEAWAFPPWSLALSGFRHLWFLQFVFLAAIVLAPVIRMVADQGVSRRSHAAVYAMAGLAWASVQPSLTHRMQGQLAPTVPTDMATFLTMSASFAAYVPMGVSLALVMPDIAALSKRPAAGRLVAIATCTLLVWHIVAPHRWSRELLALSMFLTLLQPLSIFGSKLLRSAARYSYGIYIVHFGLVALAAWLLQAASGRSTPLIVLSLTTLVFVASFLIAVALRTLWPADWLMPLVPVDPIPSNEHARRRSR